jgi:hypothetical protein
MFTPVNMDVADLMYTPVNMRLPKRGKGPRVERSRQVRSGKWLAAPIVEEIRSEAAA